MKNKPIYGMIHLSFDNADDSRIKRAIREMEVLEEEGVDGVIIENYHGDVNDMTNLINESRSFLKDTKLSVGVNILPNNFDDALYMASYYDFDFIQLDYITGKYEAHNVFTSTNVEVNHSLYLELRKRYKDVKVFGGVWPKYYVPVKGSNLEADVKSATTICDAVVVTGSGTGKETPLDKIKQFRGMVGDFPLIIGAGLTSDNVIEQLSIADGAIVGSCFKGGNTHREIKRDLVKEFMDKVKTLR